MTFGMPRALFAVLSLTVYHAGAAGTGALYSAVAAGATLAVLTSGWIRHARRLGQIVIGAVLVWGAAIALAGLVHTIGPAIVLLALAGFADSVSAVCRTTINQTVTPDKLRGRMSAVYSLVVTSGPRLGDIESGTVAGFDLRRDLGYLRRHRLRDRRRRDHARVPAARGLRDWTGTAAARRLALSGRGVRSRHLLCSTPRARRSVGLVARST